MYGVQGGSLIAMGDPVAADRQQEELAWQFRELCDRYGMRCVFTRLMGLIFLCTWTWACSLSILEKEARVPLKDFSLEGSKRKSLRQDVNRAVKAGCSFEVVPLNKLLCLFLTLKPSLMPGLPLSMDKRRGFLLVSLMKTTCHGSRSLQYGTKAKS